MKKPLVLSAMLFLFTGLAMAQQPTGALTIFSEDGDKFFLILNGERQNNVAQTNLRVEDLPQPYYNAKVIFEDKTLGEIGKNLQIATGGETTLMDVTYKIKKDKNNGKINLRYFSAIPMQQGFLAQANVYVMHFGAPAAAVVPAGGETISRTTTTTARNNGNVNMNVGGMGVNMNVSVTDPNMATTSQTTTTRTTTTTRSNSTEVIEQPVPARAESCAGNFCMSGGNFSSALATVKKEGFDETRLSTAKQIASSNCLDANQVAAICKEFGFEETKLGFAKFAYTHCTEPNNYFKVNNVFGFSSSVDDLNKYIQSK